MIGTNVLLKNRNKIQKYYLNFHMIMIVELNFQSNEHFDLHHNFLQYQHNHWTHHLYVGECWNVFNYKALTSRPHCLT